MHTRLGTYRHFKGGFYHVIGTGIDATNGGNPEEPVVIYRAAEGKRDLFVRSAKEFHEQVVVDDKQVARFAFIPKTDGW